MTIEDMHIWFRQFTQQMGMQNVRAILPEQIDLFLNTSITDIVNTIIQTNISETHDKAITGNEKLNQINGLSTLYKTKVINNTSSIGDVTTFKVDQASPIGKIVVDDVYSSDILYITALNISYDYNNKQTLYYPVRITDDLYLSNSLSDYMLQPKLQSPIAVFVNNKLELYIGSLNDGFSIHDIKLSYIKKPIVVNYENKTDCDLPESKHIDVVKHSIDLYNVALNGIQAVNQQRQLQQQQQAQQYANQVQQ